jgi:hypothetical protein
MAAGAAADPCGGMLPLSGGRPSLEGRALGPEADRTRARGLSAPAGRPRTTIPVVFLPSKQPSRKRSLSLEGEEARTKAMSASVSPETTGVHLKTRPPMAKPQNSRGGSR